MATKIAPPAALAVLGMGKMGAAMALRLRECGVAVSIYNRSPAKAESVRAAALDGACLTNTSASAAVERTIAGST
eukprot:CAMPEP_0119528436 /NCGR_PEP_ID=MMETSP1344-20130328/42637_1 /TAXON_ID=236787 /ORGANISM="Florenciella parvula, Strain CCMP2471" /LENGTH=74 /DNA_ID=CAMNT_0007567833 /DNA_START=89 /DNA_END=310 /DNA_ORIENTATION=-